ncbi:MAG: hypothetical protein IID17_13270 [Nitrospinae bacterium]|nr:hypothetical protein [Nitrospinota bacterium]
MVAASIANIGHSGDRSKSPIGGLKQSEAADLLNTSRSNVQRATKVQESGVPELSEKVMAGEVAVSTASDIAAKDIDCQREDWLRLIPVSLRVAILPSWDN